MSRAFVKEPEGDEDPGPVLARVRPPGPGYVTPRGLRALKQREKALRALRAALADQQDAIAARAERQRLERELADVRESLARAVVVDPGRQARSEIRFGAEVRAEAPDGEVYAFAIVGEDEAGTEEGAISFTSPLARALIGRTVGDRVVWERPAGDRELRVLSFRYPEN